VADGSTVSLRGLLFKTLRNPVLTRTKFATMRNLALRSGPRISPTPLWGRLWDPLVIVRLSSERTVTKSFPFSEKSGRPFEVRAGWSRNNNRRAKQLQSRTGLWADVLISGAGVAGSTLAILAWTTWLAGGALRARPFPQRETMRRRIDACRCGRSEPSRVWARQWAAPVLRRAVPLWKSCH